MNTDIKLFLKKLSMFLLPLLLLAGAIAYIDPFEYFAMPSNISSEVKGAGSSRLNYALWKTVHYRKNPEPNLILGDSRVGQINEKLIGRFTDEKYYNFGYGGGSLPEIISTFWFAAGETRLQHVYIGINLSLYNEYLSRNRVPGALSILQNPLLYLINRDVWKASFLVAKKVWLGMDTDIEKPPMNQEQFWMYQLTTTADRYYGRYAHPDKYYKELSQIVDYCRTNGIELVFLILPTHIDLQNCISQHYGLQQAAEQMLTDLCGLGTTIDFNYPNGLTEAKENFSDPYHLKSQAMEKVVEDVWGKAPLYGRRL
jgi:hypothetical protein